VRVTGPLHETEKSPDADVVVCVVMVHWKLPQPWRSGTAVVPPAASDVHLPRSAELVLEEPLVAGVGVGEVTVLVLLYSQPAHATSAAKPRNTVDWNRVFMVRGVLNVRGFWEVPVQSVQDSIGQIRAGQQC
jgi:hypothetical protein